MKNQNIKFKKGDLLKAFDNKKVDCIAHQCNTFLTADKCGGIAGLLFNCYPSLRDNHNTYINNYKNNNHQLLGDAKGVTIKGINYIFNIYSQYKAGNPTTGIDSMECRLSYLKEGLTTVANYIIAGNMKTLGLPLIASGLARQAKAECYRMSDLEYFKKFMLPTIKEVFKDYDIQVTIMYL